MEKICVISYIVVFIIIIIVVVDLKIERKVGLDAKNKVEEEKNKEWIALQNSRKEKALQMEEVLNE
jgi:hypothetical protein